MPARGVTGFLVICIGFGLAAAEEPQPGSSAKDRVRGDLAYASEDGLGVVILRPAAFFQSPGMKSLAGIVNGFIAKDVCHLDDRKKLTVSVDSIEQITGEFIVTKTDRGMSIGPRPRVIRMTQPFDWKKQFHALAPELEPPDYFMANDRTMVLEPEAKYQQRQAAAPPGFTSCPEWKEVEHCIAICALSNSHSQWTRELDPMLKDFELEAEGRAAVRSIRDLNYVIIGVDLSEGFVVKAFLHFRTEQAARSLFELYEASLPAMRQEWRLAKEFREVEPKTDNAAEKAYFQTIKDLVNNGSVHREGSVITLRSTAKLALADRGIERALASLLASR